MQENEQMNLQESKEKEATNQYDFFIGKANLKVKLGSDVNDGFLDRLRIILEKDRSDGVAKSFNNYHEHFQT